MSSEFAQARSGRRIRARHNEIGALNFREITVWPYSLGKKICNLARGGCENGI